MAHLDNSKRVIEVRLTAAGRRRLAEGKGVDITQFALADDEVDYTLWQDDLPPEERGALIENLPVFEAFTDETQSMRYKLVTLEGGSDKVPRLSLPDTLRLDSASITVNPETSIDGDPVPLDELIGYTAIVKNNTYLSVISTEEPEKTNATVPAMYKDKIGAAETESVVGTEFELRRSASNIKSDKQVEVTIVGNETGLSFDITVNIPA